MLKLAIVLLNDKTGYVDDIVLDKSIIEKIEGRRWGKKRLKLLLAEAEQELRKSTTTLT